MARTTYILLFGRLTERWAVLLSVERKSKTCTIFIARLIELPLHTISCAEFPQMCWVVCWNLYISEIPHRLLLVYTARRQTSRMTSQNRELPNRSRFYYRHRRRRQWARGRGRRRRRGELGESSQVKHSVCGCCGGARCCRTIFSSYTTCLNIDFFLVCLSALSEMLFLAMKRKFRLLTCCAVRMMWLLEAQQATRTKKFKHFCCDEIWNFYRLRWHFAVDSRKFRRHQIITASIITREEIFENKNNLTLLSAETGTR